MRWIGQGAGVGLRWIGQGPQGRSTQHGHHVHTTGGMPVGHTHIVVRLGHALLQPTLAVGVPIPGTAHNGRAAACTHRQQCAHKGSKCAHTARCTNGKVQGTQTGKHTSRCTHRLPTQQLARRQAYTHRVHTQVSRRQAYTHRVHTQVCIEQRAHSRLDTACPCQR